MGAKRVQLDTQLVHHREVAKAMDVDTETLRDWVTKGVFAEPRIAIEASWLYDKTIVDEYLRTGRWPEAATFRQGVGRGRSQDSPKPMSSTN